MTFITDWQFTFSVFSFFLFVAFRFNRLTGVVRSSLQNIQKAIKVSMFNVLLLRVLKIRRTGRLFSKSLSLSVIDSELSIKKCTPTGCCVRKCHGKPNSCCVTKLSYDHIHDTRALLEEINKWISFFFWYRCLNLLLSLSPRVLLWCHRNLRTYLEAWWWEG